MNYAANHASVNLIVVQNNCDVQSLACGVLQKLFRGAIQSFFSTSTNGKAEWNISSTLFDHCHAEGYGYECTFMSPLKLRQTTLILLADLGSFYRH